MMHNPVSHLFFLLFFCAVIAAQVDPVRAQGYSDAEPVALNMDEVKAQISYPAAAKANMIEGKVVVRLVVDKAGQPVKYMVLKTPHPLLTRAVTDKIMLLRFSPGVVNDHPKKVWVTIPFEFKLLEEWRTYPDKYKISNTWTESTVLKDKKCEEEFLPHAVDLTVQLQLMEEKGLPPFVEKQRKFDCTMAISKWGG
jgi:TonB family protein